MAGAKKWFKKRSKRIPTKLRVKAEKKLREHNRKVLDMCFSWMKSSFQSMQNNAV